MPLLLALASRASFSGQRAVGRAGQATQLLLDGTPVMAADGSFAGFRGRALPEQKATPTAANEAGNGVLGLDPALDHALRSPIDRIIRAAEGIAERSEGPLRSDYAAYAGDIEERIDPGESRQTAFQDPLGRMSQRQVNRQIIR